MVSLFIFTLDIILNFFTTYLIDDKYETDLNNIVIGYLKGWFIMDFIATFPFDMFLQIDFNSQFIKGIKMIKLIKLLRIIKIDASSFDENAIAKTEFGSDLIQL